MEFKTTIEEDFSTIESLFYTLGKYLEYMMIPFTLYVVEPNGLIRITEDEKLDFEKDFSKFKQKYAEIVNFCKVFFRKLKESNYPKNGLIGDSFSKKLDRQIEDTIEFYNDIMANTINIPKKELLDLQKSYFAYITISRCLNSFIKIYNTNKPNYKIPELKKYTRAKIF